MEITENFVEKNKDKRFTITFETGLTLKNIKLFVGQFGGIGYLSGRQKRLGRAFPLYINITNIVEVKKKEYDDVSNAKTILKKIHPNVWDDMKNEMNDVIHKGIIDQDFKWHYQGRLKFRNISNLLSASERERLKQSFENKERFSWKRYTNSNSGRDLSISCEVGSDGKFRAWFSSEYMGCGNGDYWLLLNPTTAIYYEAD